MPDANTNEVNETFSSGVLVSVMRHYLGIGQKPVSSLDELTRATGLEENQRALSALSQGVQALTKESTEKSNNSSDFIWPGRNDEWLISNLDSLPERERKVIELRYGIADGNVSTLEEVGGEFRVTRERIRQIEQRALRQLNPDAREFLQSGRPRWSGRLMARSAQKIFARLSSRAGEDVHSVSDLLAVFSADSDAWPFGFNVPTDIRDCDPETVIKKVLGGEGALWIDADYDYFLKVTAKSPYANITGKFLNTFDKVAVDAVHDGISQTWRTRTSRASFDLSVEELAFALAGLGFEVAEGMVSPGDHDVKSENLMAVSPIEQTLLDAFEYNDYFADLDQLRQKVPALKRVGSSENQYLMGMSSLFERLGPSLYGVRGAPYDIRGLAAAQAVARSASHAWNNRAGWGDSAGEESLTYHLSGRKSAPSDIAMTEAVAFWMVEEFDGFSAEVDADTGAGGSYSLELRRVGGSIRLHGLSAIWNDLRPGKGDLVNITKLENASLHFSIHEINANQNGEHRVEVNLGRGWVSTSR